MRNISALPRDGGGGIRFPVRPSPPPGARAKPFFGTFRRGFGERGPPVHPPLGRRLTRKGRIVVVEGIELLESTGAVSTRRQQSSHPHRGADPGDRRRPRRSGGSTGSRRGALFWWELRPTRENGGRRGGGTIAVCDMIISSVDFSIARKMMSRVGAIRRHIWRCGGDEKRR